MTSTHTLRIFHKQAPVCVLGPGKRAVIWVQGCSFACPGCIVPESWNTEGGETIDIDTLSQWVLNQTDLDGVTLSGGEPMLQAAALVNLIDRLQSQSDLGVVCYTGYTWETLQKHGTPEQLALLSRIDLLIDGRFLEEQQADLRWRGSANQRLLPLSDRYQHDLPQTPQNDRSAGLEFGLDESGTLFFSGVPPQANFRERFEAGLRQRGITLPTA